MDPAEMRRRSWARAIRGIALGAILAAAACFADDSTGDDPPTLDPPSGSPGPAAPSPAPGAPTAEDIADFPEYTPEQAAAVNRGLTWLAGQQNSHVGSFGDRYRVAVTALACLAFLADGHVPGRGGYGKNVEKGLVYLVERCADRTGYITEPGGSQSRMHGHGFATLFLSEVFGMAPQTDFNPSPSRQWDANTPGQKVLHEVLSKAVKVICESQTGDGGWNYEPRSTDGDEASITVCEVQALRAARNAGIRVEPAVITRAVRYVRECHNKADGSFCYSLAHRSRQSSFALTAAAVSTLNYTGTYDCAELRNGLVYMMRHKPADGHSEGHYFYGQYYAALAMYYAGGKYWSTWYPLIRAQLLKKQATGPKGGYWPDEDGVGNEFSTALALLILQIPKRLLPIFQK